MSRKNSGTERAEPTRLRNVEDFAGRIEAGQAPEAAAQAKRRRGYQDLRGEMARSPVLNAAKAQA